MPRKNLFRNSTLILLFVLFGFLSVILSVVKEREKENEKINKYFFPLQEDFGYFFPGEFAMNYVVEKKRIQSEDSGTTHTTSYILRFKDTVSIKFRRNVFYVEKDEPIQITIFNLTKDTPFEIID